MWTATSTGAPYAAGTPLVSRTERHKRNCIFTTPVSSARLEPTKGRTRCRYGYGGPRGYAASSLAPGPSPYRQPERRQMTHHPQMRSHKSAWALTAPPRGQPNTLNRPNTHIQETTPRSDAVGQHPCP
jgi:hypothetical protein